MRATVAGLLDSCRTGILMRILSFRLTMLCACLSIAAASTAEESNNAALQYWVAFTLCPPEKGALGSATTDNETYGFEVPVSQELARCFQADGERALRYLHRGALLPVCDWGTDLRKDGPTVAAPQGNKAHALARLSLLRARWRFEHADWDGGIDDVIATMMLGRHIGRDKIWYNIHFGCMLENMSTTTLSFYLPRMPGTSRERLARELERLPPPPSMREVVLYYENSIDWAVENFKRAEQEGRLFELIASISSDEQAKTTLALAGNAAALVKLAEAGRPLVHEVAEALLLPPEQYDRVYKERFAPQLEANPVAAMLGTAYDSARGEEATAHCRFLYVQTAIDLLRRGKSALHDHPDPYGDGPFEYAEFDSGFSLCSDLVYRSRVRPMYFGVARSPRKN